MSPRPLAVALLCAACSSSTEPAPSGEGFPTAPLATLTGDAGQLHVEVRTSPQQPPARGSASVQYVVRDVDGATVDGLTITLVPWMPAHAHGSSVQPTVSAQGGGVYVATGVAIFMPGHWELRTDFSGPKTDHVAPSFDVP